MSSPVPWQNFVFVAATIPSLSLYTCILAIAISRRRKRQRFMSTFYSLLISLGFADFFATGQALFLYIARTSNIWNDFYWNNRSWVAPLTYNGAIFGIAVRLFGATLIALQRYIAVCHGHTAWAGFLSELKLSYVFLIHWIPPFLVCLPITLNVEKTLMGPTDLRIYVVSSQTELAALLQNLFVLITFSISAYAYIQIFRLLIKSPWSNMQGRSREVRLSVVALGQGVSFLAVFVYFVAQYVLSQTGSSFVNDIRLYWLLISAFESYWNPWIYLVLNADVRNELGRIFRKSRGRESSMGASSLAQNQPKTTSVQSTRHCFWRELRVE